MKSLPPQGSLVRVTWDDAGFEYEEDARDDATRDDACTVETVGWIVRITRKAVWIAAEKVSYSASHRAITRVPRVLIERVVVFRKAGA